MNSPLGSSNKKNYHTPPKKNTSPSKAPVPMETAGSATLTPTTHIITMHSPSSSRASTPMEVTGSAALTLTTRTITMDSPSLMEISNDRTNSVVTFGAVDTSSANAGPLPIAPAKMTPDWNEFLEKDDSPTNSATSSTSTGAMSRWSAYRENHDDESDDELEDIQKSKSPTTSPASSTEHTPQTHARTAISSPFMEAMAALGIFAVRADMKTSPQLSVRRQIRFPHHEPPATRKRERDSSDGDDDVNQPQPKLRRL